MLKWNRLLNVSCFGLLLWAGIEDGLADVRVPKCFSPHMVLQREMPIPVWGWAAVGESITVEFSGQKKTAVADENGKWMVTLNAQQANAVPAVLKITGKNEIQFEDVLVGEVWLCSGQSNMEWPVSGSMQLQQAVDVAKNPTIRHFKTKNTQSHTRQNDLSGGEWVVCSPETVANFSAVGFFFAEKLNRDLNVPIGLINSSWGGSCVETWISVDGFKQVPELNHIRLKAEEMDFLTEAGNAKLAEHVTQMKQWVKQAEDAVAAKQCPPAQPASINPDPNHQLPTRLYNAMIHPWVPYAFRGVIWYQGETNGTEGVTYLQKLKALVGGWRSIWKQGDFPFYLVQLANYKTSDPNQAAGGDGWAKIREAQFDSIRDIPNTGMAVTIDIGDARDIHPKNKLEVGERLARWALQKTYQKPGVHTGPLYTGHVIEGSQVRVSFEGIGSGLMIGEKSGPAIAKEVATGKLDWFSIAGEDRVWKRAEAKIEGNTVVVTSPQVEKPVAVRYAFFMNPTGANLFNKEGLPASPFRTDRW